MTSYTTLQRAKQQMTVKNSTQDDSLIAGYIEAASQIVDDYCGQSFNEVIYTYAFNGEVGSQNPTLSLDERPLLAITSLLNGDGTVVIPANYTLLPVGSLYPKQRVRLALGNYWLNTAWNSNGNCGPAYSPLLDRAYAEDAIQITGLWGFHRNYLNAWGNTGYTVNAGSLPTATTLTTTQAQPLTALDVGNVVKITTAGGLTEYMRISGPVANSTAAGLTTNALTVDRAYNNSTQQTFAGGETIYVWRTEPVIDKVTQMMVAFLYESRNDATGNSFSITEIGTTTISVDLPPRIKRLLSYPYYNSFYGKP